MGFGKHVIDVESLIYIKQVRELIEKNKKHPIKSSFVSYEVTNPSLMIDWVSVKIPFYCERNINNGNMISLDQNGEMEFSIDKHLSVEGSHDSKIRVRTEDGRFPPVDQLKHLKILAVSGNPVKWFQGHNIFGTHDLNNLVFEMFLMLAKKLESEQPDWVVDAVKNGHYTVSRVDINGMYELDSRDDVLTWLQAIEKTGRTRHGTALNRGNTVYFGKNSERWTLKFYAKGQEIEASKHQLPVALQSTSLPKFANNKLRAELTLRSKELVKLGLNLGSSWSKIDVWEIYKDYMSRVDMSEQRVKDNFILELSPRLRSSYLLWKDGHDLRLALPKSTYYDHRRDLLKLGIDISVPLAKEVKSNVVPLRKILELRPAGVPDWAIGTELYFEPRKLTG